MVMKEVVKMGTDSELKEEIKENENGYFKQHTRFKMEAFLELDQFYYTIYDTDLDLIVENYKRPM